MAGDDERSGPKTGTPAVLAGPSDTENLLHGRYDGWRIAYAAWLEAIGDERPGEADVRRKAATDTRLVSIRQAAMEPPRTPAEFGALLHVWWEEYGPDLLDHDLAQMDEDGLDPSARFIAWTWRATTGMDGWPRAIEVE